MNALLGWVIIAAVFGGIFKAVSGSVGVRATIEVFVIVALLAALLVYAKCLIAGSI